VLAPETVVALSSSLTFPLELWSPAALNAKVACHFPGPIDESDSCVATLVGPNDRVATFVVVIAEIVTD